MRPVLHGDVVSAARVLYALRKCDRHRAMIYMLRDATLANQYRELSGRCHPRLGNGSLMSVALAKSPPPEPRLSDRDYCACLALVFQVLAEGVLDMMTFTPVRS